MNKVEALVAIDAAINALTGLEHALKHGNSSMVELEVQRLWIELSYLREMAENMKDEEK